MTMKVFCNGFWYGFFDKSDPIHSGFFVRLLSDVFDEDVMLSNNIDDADILLESIFTNTSYINYKAWKSSFLFTGESFYANCMKDHLSSYTCILGFNPTARNYVEFPFYIVYLMSFPNMKFEPAKAIANPYTSAVISNGSLNERTTFLDKLERRLPVIYGGSYKNNIGGKLEGHYASDNLTNFYKNSKFAITMENARVGHYITEKLINGFKAGVVPIYWGSKHVAEHFNSKRFIILEDTTEDSMNRVIDRMATMSDEEYFNMVNEPIFKKDVSIDSVYKKAVANIKNIVIKKIKIDSL